MNLKRDFSRFLGSDPDRLHAAAHSHHPWPDVTFGAHQQAWLDAAAFQDGKWDRVLGDVLPEAAGHIARLLGLPDPATIAVAPNTHDLVRRILSCLPDRPRILTTDAEFHSFTRQVARLEEDGRVVAERVTAQPFGSFPERFAAAAARGGHDLVFFSQVHFDSGYAVGDVPALVAAVPAPETFVVVDGYHGFMALPTDAGPFVDRAFYLAGGYKYAMAGEGCCFLHCPPGYGPRPVDTGWYAGFGALEQRPAGRVAYAPDGRRFLGATFDPAGWYRFNAVQRWLADVGVKVDDVHAHVRGLQDRFLDRLGRGGAGLLDPGTLLPPEGTPRGNFLTFRLPDAGAVHRRLQARNVVVDHRGDRLRVGFGLYHDARDVDELCSRLAV